MSTPETIEPTIDIDTVMKAIPPMEIQTITKIKMDRLHDLLCTALEGGVGYWCQITKYNPAEGKTKKDYQYPHLDIIFDGGSITVRDCISEGEGCDPEFEPKDVTLEDLKKGLTIMAEKYDWHFNNFINDNDDAETGDVFFQCAVMGDIVFG
jgi:hypothetical protein